MFFRPQKQSVGRSPHKSYKVTQMQKVICLICLLTQQKPYYTNKYDDGF